MWDDTYANMLHMLDVGTMNVTNALKQAGFWENTLFLFSADNGGIGKFGNNYPLRGHKHDPWEGKSTYPAWIAFTREGCPSTICPSRNETGSTCGTPSGVPSRGR